MIIPQAVRVVFPTYKAEVISLIKNTSIVGYVSVNDLTRMSDIIRGRTYDAFFPLVFDAIVYFAFSYIIVRVIEAAFEKFNTRYNTNV